MNQNGGYINVPNFEGKLDTFFNYLGNAFQTNQQKMKEINIVSDYVYKLLYNEEMSPTFFKMMNLPEDIVIVDSLNIAQWSDPYNIIMDMNLNDILIAFPEQFHDTIRGIFWDTKNHLRLVKLGRVDPNINLLEMSRSIITLLWGGVVSTMIRTGMGIYPNFIIVHRDDQDYIYQDEFPFIYVMGISNPTNQNMPEIDDLLVVTMLYAFIESTNARRVSILSADMYDWAGQFLGPVPQNLQDLRNLIDNNRALSVRIRDTNQYELIFNTPNNKTAIAMGSFA